MKKIFSHSSHSQPPVWECYQNLRVVKKILLVIFFLIISSFQFANAQVELVNIQNPVYDFLKKMQVMEIIPNYNSSFLPVSREQVANYLSIIKDNEDNLSKIDKKYLNDYLIEFNYDLNKNADKDYSFFSNPSLRGLLQNDKEKHLYVYSDSSVSMFIDGIGNLSYRTSSGDSIGSNHVTLGELGFRIRGTLFNSVGYYLRASNGRKLSGNNDNDLIFALNTDPKLRGNTKFSFEGEFFDTYEGYIRYQTKTNWLSLTVGRDNFASGFGYIDKMYISPFALPFDFVNLNLNYKSLSYSFVYGNIKGDSLGVDLTSKNIVTHRVNLKISDRVKAGFYEAIIISDLPFSFTFFNPISVLRSADYVSGSSQTSANNALMGFDLEIIPVSNVALQGTFLIDDFNFSTIGSDDRFANDNKFGWQFGLLWANSFSIPNLTMMAEYTRLNPFVYSHNSNKSTYTNWRVPIGQQLQPNSDEIAVRSLISITNRLVLDVKFQHQRHAQGFIFDSEGNLIINYGGNIERGDGDTFIKNVFLDGTRINTNLLTLNLNFQPIKQYYLNLTYLFRNFKYIQSGRSLNDNIIFSTIRIDL